ncbi:hypothetical protein PR202_ga15721 [Eleusine coracana subsp. coracana]|uniref:Flavonoid 3'-monooxygenase n=1 Tax=Eleusine coracana subsp. coracana TaxID=191504 RepID=A0AAV5CL72_ELECO|nr:hypothetical protein QOZ80_6BG0489740 [Eleusine coracana subsp. coracana]GJM98691.1 hypothetical protein PR202_ga15721 [Eleusine coracana subsp. coracana]
MELPPWAVCLIIVLATVLFLKTILSRGRRACNLPPGPKPWPIIGNLNLIGSLPHRSIHALSKKYGPLMQLQFGSVPVVVGSSEEMAKFFLKTHDAVFADRPRFAVGKYSAYEYSDLLLAPYGPYWRQARKICAAELFSAKRLESLQHIRDEEVRVLLRNLDRVSGCVVRLKDHLQMMMLGVISRMVLGKKYIGEGTSLSSEEFMEMMKEFSVLNGVLNIGDFFPWLDWLDLQGYVRRMKRMGKMSDRFLEPILEEHDERRRLEGDAFVPRDMVDVLLQLADDPNLEVPLSRNNVKAITQDLLIAATDTSAMTVEWAISELLKNPELLANATEELDNVIGRDRLVTETDLPHLPYIEAVLKETMRLHPPAPLLPPHLSRENTSVNGYAIPAGTIALVNVWAIARDPMLWEAPEEFQPERFVGSMVDVKGQHFELLPFGSGRRMCPGYGLGLKMMMLSLANLLHGFVWRLPKGVTKEELNMEETYLLATPRKVPLEAVLGPRLPACLYTDA